MKKSFLATTIFFVLILFGYLNAQITSEAINRFDEGFISYEASGIVSGTDTVYTAGFRLGSGTKAFDVFALGSQSNDSVKIKIVRQISVFGNWVTDKTVGTDSVKTEKAWGDTSSYFNVLHRLAVVGVTGNGYRTAFSLKISAKRE